MQKQPCDVKNGICLQKQLVPVILENIDKAIKDAF